MNNFLCVKPKSNLKKLKFFPMRTDGKLINSSGTQILMHFHSFFYWKKRSVSHNHTWLCKFSFCMKRSLVFFGFVIYSDLTGNSFYLNTFVSLQTFAIPGSIFLSILSGYLFPFPLALFLVCLVSKQKQTLNSSVYVCVFIIVYRPFY